MPFDLETWKTELLETGRIVQDGDNSVSPEEAERRFNRYIELVEQVNGSEGMEAIAALLQSIQVKDDYGGYQVTYRILSRFPDKQMIEVFVSELPSLIARQPDWAGDFLVGFANGKDTKWDYLLQMFNAEVASSAPAVRQPIVDYVRSQEPAGWLRRRVGVLCPVLPQQPPLQAANE
jgi:hypothetical protein